MKTKGSVIHSDDDVRLIESFKKGDKEAFDLLVEKYMDRMFRLCYRFLGDYEDAKDCAQDVFIKAYNALEGFRGKSSFYTWLYRVAVNTCKNKLGSIEYRFFKKKVPINQGAGDEGNGDSVNLQADGKHTPASIFEQREREQIIQSAIDALPPRQKIVIVLCDVEGFKYEEIAQITALSVGTVKSRVFRARRTLRKKLEGLV